MAASTPLTPEQRSMRARTAIHARWANEDPTANALRGQAGLRARFDREAREATPGLTDAEYARRSGHLYKAHMARLALASHPWAPGLVTVSWLPCGCAGGLGHLRVSCRTDGCGSVWYGPRHQQASCEPPGRLAA